jgi:hypothetical protein
VSSHGSHIGCDGEAAWGAACCRREDRNSTRFRRIRRRGGSWNGRAPLGVGLGVGVAVCSESERSQMNTMMGSILKSICKRSSIASIPRQEQVAGQIDAHTSMSRKDTHSNPAACGGWDRSVAGCRVRIMVCDTARRPGVGDCDACLASCFLTLIDATLWAFFSSSPGRSPAGSAGGGWPCSWMSWRPSDRYGTKGT